MASREELQQVLEKLLGNRNVYYKPPEKIKMGYPAIVYSKNRIKTTHADSAVYLKLNQYTLTVIDRNPDNPVIDELLKLPYCSFDRSYCSDNLNHDVLTLYF